MILLTARNQIVDTRFATPPPTSPPSNARPNSTSYTKISGNLDIPLRLRTTSINVETLALHRPPSQHQMNTKINASTLAQAHRMRIQKKSQPFARRRVLRMCPASTNPPQYAKATDSTATPNSRRPHRVGTSGLADRGRLERSRPCG